MLQKKEDPILWEIHFQVRKVEGRFLNVQVLHRTDGWKTLPLDNPLVIDLMEALEQEDKREKRKREVGENVSKDHGSADHSPSSDGNDGGVKTGA